MARGRIASALHLLLVLLFNCSVVRAQEKPKYKAVPYDSIGNYRQNVCPRHDLYYNGTVEMRDALAGLELNVVLEVGRLFPLKDGAIDEEYPGFMGTLLDELAVRAGFTWRNSFAVTYGPGEGKTYTDLFLWGTNAYDLYADWMTQTVERLKRGLGSPEGFYDASYILVGVKPESSEQKASLFNWLEPFDAVVWWAILATIVGSPIFYSILERLNQTDPKERLSFSTNLFFSSLVFSQHFMYLPKSHAARIFSGSMAFWSLITVATYTANLASFFVVQNTPVIQINSIEDAIQAKMPICIWQGSASAEFVSKQYALDSFVAKDSEEATFEGVVNGDCSFALTSVTSWEQFEKDRSVNSNCDLTWMGRVVKFVDAGFAVKNDAGVLCTTLIHNVLNIHLVEMQADGFMESAWLEYFRKNQDIDCDAMAAGNDEVESLKLTWDQMAGTFYVHCAAAIVALLVTVWGRMNSERSQNKKAAAGDENDEDVSERIPAINSIPEHTEEGIDSVGPTDLQKEVKRLRKSQNKQNKKLTQIMDLMQEILNDENTLKEIMDDSAADLQFSEKDS